MATTPRTTCLKLQALCSYLTFFLSSAGSGMLTKEMMMNEMANTPIAMNRRGATSLIAVLSVTVPIRTPTSRGVRVPVRELKVPPICMYWLPLFPPPPRSLSIGLTTVLSMQTQNPQTKAPSR